MKPDDWADPEMSAMEQTTCDETSFVLTLAAVEEQLMAAEAALGAMAGVTQVEHGVGPRADGTMLVFELWVEARLDDVTLIWWMEIRPADPSGWTVERSWLRDDSEERDIVGEWPDRTYADLSLLSGGLPMLVQECLAAASDPSAIRRASRRERVSLP